SIFNNISSFLLTSASFLYLTSLIGRIISMQGRIISMQKSIISILENTTSIPKNRIFEGSASSPWLIGGVVCSRLISLGYSLYTISNNLILSKEIELLTVNKEQQKLLLSRQSKLLDVINSQAKEEKVAILKLSNVINSNIKKHKIAKIISISSFSLGLVTAAIGSLSVMISVSLLGVGLISAIATRCFSKKIEGDCQEISKKQKESKLNCSYKLYSNKLFYMKMKATN
ncbi:MAG: hypothetical protein K1060chlam4_00792, partial [Candidatus Anoxychlamydiales bacterium]|nr:hypothetical protein [Candidatus Anoxychlamydiales bacterium]